MPVPLKIVEAFVTRLLSEELDEGYRYHNLEHTRRVVGSTQELLGYYNLEESEQRALLMAAWLHDTGYIHGREGHEEESARIAAKFLSEQGIDTATVERICSLILATERYHQPENRMEEIIRDADAAHLGMDTFKEISELLREELAVMGIAQYTPQEWRDLHVEIFRSEHRFYTAYAREHWQPGKDRNLQKLLDA